MRERERMSCDSLAAFIVNHNKRMRTACSAESEKKLCFPILRNGKLRFFSHPSDKHKQHTTFLVKLDIFALTRSFEITKREK